MVSFRAFVAAALLSFAIPVLAHEGGVDARGTIVDVSKTRIVLKTPGGENKSFVVLPNTEFRRGSEQMNISDISTGEKVVVHARKSKRGEPEATSIRLPKRAAATK